VLLEQTQSKNESLKRQLEEAHDKTSEQAHVIQELHAEKAAMEKQLVQYLEQINASIPLPPDSQMKSDVLIPADLSPDQWAEISMTKKHVIEWDWTSPNGLEGIYTGWLDLEGNPDGHGTLRIKDGSVYTGQWKKGRKNGNGVYASSDGDLYAGPYLNDKFHGRGVYVSEENQVYTGDWQNGMRHGNGINTWDSGSRYVGAYKNDSRNGKYCI
jgi:hypothetical protein